MGEYFKKKLQTDFLIIYLEASFEERVAREAVKTGKSVSEIRQLTYDKDMLKVSHGAIEYKNISDYLIGNDDTKDRLNEKLEKIIELEIKLRKPE